MTVILLSIANAMAITTTFSPALCTTTEWNNCLNAFADGGSVATAGDNDEVVYKKYDINIPSNAIISQVMLVVDSYENGSSNKDLTLDVSNNNGSSFGSDHEI